MRRFFRMAAVLLAALLLAYCGFTEKRAAAEAVVARYFEALRAGDYQGAVDLYADSYRQRPPPGGHPAQLRALNGRLGDLQTYAAMEWSVKKSAGAIDATYVQVTYDVRYSRGRVRELFILQTTGDDETFQILDHRIRIQSPPGQGETRFI
jgi:ketosteroid isomerase-like protein